MTRIHANSELFLVVPQLGVLYYSWLTDTVLVLGHEFPGEPLTSRSEIGTEASQSVGQEAGTSIPKGTQLSRSVNLPGSRRTLHFHPYEGGI